MKKNIKEAMIVSPAGQTDASTSIKEDEDFEEKGSYWYVLEFPKDANIDGFYVSPTNRDHNLLAISKVDDKYNTLGEYTIDLSGEEPIFKKSVNLTEKVKSVKKVIQENKNKIKKFKEAVCDLDEDQVKNIADDIRFIADDYFAEDQSKFDQLNNAADKIENFDFEEALELTSDIADNSPDVEIAESIWDAVAPLRQC